MCTRKVLWDGQGSMGALHLSVLCSPLPSGTAPAHGTELPQGSISFCSS